MPVTSNTKGASKDKEASKAKAAEKAPAKSESKKATEPKKAGDEPKVKVTTANPTKKAAETPEYKVVTGRVSGKHRVKFLPNGTQPRLGTEIITPAASTAQSFVDQGLGQIVE